MAKRPQPPQLAFAFEEASPEAPIPAAPTAKPVRPQPTPAGVWRYPGDPEGDGWDMVKRCQNTYPELGGLQCLLRTRDTYCDTCAKMEKFNRKAE